MARINIPEYDIYYDEETGLVHRKDDTICSNIPKGTFPFKGKLYTYGTKVKMSAGYIAEFKQDTEEKKTSSGYTIKMSETKEYFDGRKFELDEIFAEVGGKRKSYNSYGYHFDNDIEEIVEPKYFTIQPNNVTKETPPELNGYKTVVYEDKTNPSRNRYQDMLRRCDVDINGEVLSWFAPNTFGYGKHIYTIGTKVLMKYRDHIWKKNHYFVATFNGYDFVVDGYPTTHNNISAKKFQKSQGGDRLAYKILLIVEPHYYRPEGRKVTAWDRFKSGGGSAPVDTFHGTLLYIAIMVVGTIFKARWMIWIFSTIIYFLWKYGYTNKK